MKKKELIKKIKIVSFNLNAKEEENEKLKSEKLGLILDNTLLSIKLNRQIITLKAENEELKNTVEQLKDEKLKFYDEMQQKGEWTLGIKAENEVLRTEVKQLKERIKYLQPAYDKGFSDGEKYKSIWRTFK